MGHAHPTDRTAGLVTAGPGTGVGTVAVVTGANRGIGLGVARQLARRGAAVVLGSRDLAKGTAAAEALAAEGLDVMPRRLDVTKPDDLQRLADELSTEYGRRDVLVHNAAAYYDTWQGAAAAALCVVREPLETTLLQ